MNPFYDIDRMPRNDILRIQGQLLEETIRHACRSNYYKSLLEGAGLKASDIKTPEDLAKLPLTGRRDIEGNNDNFFAVESSDLAEIVSTTGTTGEPVYVGLTSNDLQRLAYNEEKSFARAGATGKDLFFIDVTCDNLFIAGIAYYSGLVRLGAGVVRVGPQNIARHFALMRRLRPQGIVAVPSFMVQMARRAQEHGLRTSELGLEKIVLIGDSIRNEDLSLNPLGVLIERAFGKTFYSTYGITEGQVSFSECSKKTGLHSHPDLVITEVVDERGMPLPDGQVGELVLTTLQVEGMPLIRYRTGDITFKLPGPCECGLGSTRIGPVLGRRDHRLKFKGVTLYPKTIENAMLEMKEVENFQIEVYTGDDHTDNVLLRVGTKKRDNAFKAALLEKLRSRARVSPDLQIMTPEEVSERLFEGSSRKPVTFLDMRGERA